MKTWLKGGVYALLAYVVLTIILIPFGQPHDSWTPYFLIPSLLGLKSLTWIFNYFPIAFSFFVVPISFISSIFIYFLIGALIGLIIGKIKNKK